jgi:predicted O-linked N-acetylglucosamine transferase (SPINDLY family)
VPRPDPAAPRTVRVGGSLAAPNDAQIRQWVEQALALQRSRQLSQAIQLLQRAATARPQSAEIWNHLGNALQDARQQEQALDCYRRAASADPKFGPALQNLGYVLVAQGHVDAGIQYLEQAQIVKPLDVNYALIATALPVVYESLEDLETRRKRLVKGVESLVERGISIDTTSTLIPTNFFAVYQGENDKSLHANLGRVYRGVDATQGRPRGTPRERIRIGFLSAYFRDHTIGRLNLGRIQHLLRDQFEVVVLSVGKHDGEMAQAFARAADKFVTVSREPRAARQLIADEQLDILFFTDIGMDALTYTLAFSRMAPIQCTTWGHPVTTGSPTIDYFISSELLELPTADDHYTENLVRLATLATYYVRPQLSGPTKSRADFNLPEARHLYVCPQTLFKFHPAFDPILAEILRRDPDGELVLLEGRTTNWTRLLQSRFERTMPDVAARIRWLAQVPNEDFLQLLALADVVLDPIHFGGGNSSYEALAVGSPIVTLPGELLRSRITQALYAKMGSGASPDVDQARSLGLVAGSAAEYVENAVALATNPSRRAAAREWIRSNAHKLFEDVNEVADLAAALTQIARAPHTSSFPA